MPSEYKPGDVFLGVDPANGEPSMFTVTWDNILIGWSTCADCHKHLIHCGHDFPVEPEWLRRDHVPPTERPMFQTAVYGPKSSTDSYKILGSPSQRKGPISISDFVDDDLVAKVKKAKEDRDAGGQ